MDFLFIYICFQYFATMSDFRVERIEPANNIVELAKNLYPLRIIEQQNNSHVYVPLFNDILKDMRDRLLYSFNPHESFFISGQVGSGKTTALNFLKNQEIDDRYEIVSIGGRNLLDLDDVHVVDILLMLSFYLVEKLNRADDLLQELETLHARYEGRLEETQERMKGHKGEAGVKAELGTSASFLGLLGLKADLFAKYTGSREIKRTVREFFKFKEDDLVKITNKIITRFYTDQLNNEKELLVVFDDLEKMSNHEQVVALFVNDFNRLESISCRKVILYPVSLSADDRFMARANQPWFFNLKIYQHENEALDTINTNRGRLKEVLYKRIAAGVDLVEPEALDLAIDKSAGLLAQFVSILYEATTRVRGLNGSKVDAEDVQIAFDKLRKDRERKLLGEERMAVLVHVHQHKDVVGLNPNEVLKALQSNQIIQCENDVIWYCLNPLLVPAVTHYISQNGGE